MRDMPVIARPSPDRGPEPYVLNIAQETMQNRRFRSTLWTGRHMQLTVMSIPPGGEIGLEQHNSFDQFICIEEGRGLVKMGSRRDRLDFQQPVGSNVAVIIPAGIWHNLINTGRRPLKLFSVYAPPAHPRGTVHQTREEAEAEERSY
ncbi:MAG: cupin domain-containing protein [Eubacteriales bacterium]